LKRTKILMARSSILGVWPTLAGIPTAKRGDYAASGNSPRPCKRKTEEGEHRVRSAWSPTRSMARTPCVGARGLRTRSTPMRIRVEGVVGNLDHIVPNVVS
jgi:hypothetical protein